MKLPVVYPPITSYPELANIFSIIFTHEEKVIPWISDRFIQLVVREGKEAAVVDFYEHVDIDNYYSLLFGCPFISWLRINSSVIPYDSFSEYVSYCIHHDYYVEPCLDQYYFEFSDCYKKEHFIHSSFINEIDLYSGKARIYDFFNKKKYNNFIISTSSLNNSFNNDYLINLYKFQDADYSWNKELLKSQIIDYIEGKDSLKYLDFSYQKYNRENVYYGIKVYDYLIDYYSNNKEEYDITPIHIMYDSKQLMCKRLDFFASSLMFDSTKLDEIRNENNLLKQELLIIRNTVIKYNITKDKSAVCDVISKLKSVKEQDLLLFQKLDDLIR